MVLFVVLGQMWGAITVVGTSEERFHAVARETCEGEEGRNWSGDAGSGEACSGEAFRSDDCF